MSSTSSSLLYLLFAAAAVAACSTKKGEPPKATDPWAGSGGAKASEPKKPDDAKKIDTAGKRVVPQGQYWRHRNEKSEWMCGQAKEPEEGSYKEPEQLYKEGLKLGRKEAAAKRWGDAIVAFEYANKQRAAQDPAALSELSWAMLQAGDTELALDAAKQAAARSSDVKQKAGALYNAGRAAESLGKLDDARGFYKSSLELRDNPGITERMEKLVAPVPRTAELAPLMKECRGLPSSKAVCECLGKTSASWGGEVGIGANATCELERSIDESGALASVASSKAVPETLAPGRALVLIAKGKAGWSALRVVESSRDVDLTETPRMTHGAEILEAEVRPYRGGLLFWIASRQQREEWAIGELDATGSRDLTICALPPGEEPSCTQWVLGEWSYLETPSQREGADACESRELATYFVMMDATGKLNVTLASGVDKKGAVGEYAL